MREFVFTGEGVTGERIGSHHRPHSFAVGRVCAEPDCGTVLSVYNGDDFCALHGSRPLVEHRRRRDDLEVSVTADQVRRIA